MTSATAEIDARPLTAYCRTPWNRRDHACLGISPFNSYFSTERILGLLNWAQARFHQVHVFVPDRPAAYTLEALGYPTDRAHRKAHRQARYLRNKIDHALEFAGFADAQHPVLDAQALDDNPRYTTLHRQEHTRFETDPTFRDACLDASRWVLATRVAGEPTKDQLRSAARYFLAELPLFLDTPGIVGTASSVFCYHQPPAFLQALYRRELPCWVHPRQGFATVAASSTRIDANTTC